ncbi:MAG: rhodanese-like domain-containing protein [Steroidobacteraceae bacterium]
MERLLEYLNRHPVLAGIAVALAVAVLVYELRSRKLSYAAVRPQEAIQLMNQGAHVYDLRDAAAYAAGRINGAKHLDPSQHEHAAETLKKFKDRLLVLYCEGGSTATALTRQLHAGGFTKVFNLRGGLAQWRAEGLPLQRS